MLKILLWLVLLVFAWPLALLALIAWPFVWLLSLPFRLVGITVSTAFELIETIIRIPARLVMSLSPGHSA
jgi:hypothetical protein